MNEPQEPRTLRAILDEIKRILIELERTLNDLENTLEKSTNLLVWRIKLLLRLLVVAGFTILVLVVLWQR